MGLQLNTGHCGDKWDDSHLVEEPGRRGATMNVCNFLICFLFLHRLYPTMQFFQPTQLLFGIKLVRFHYNSANSTQLIVIQFWKEYMKKLLVYYSFFFTAMRQPAYLSTEESVGNFECATHVYFSIQYILTNR